MRRNDSHVSRGRWQNRPAQPSVQRAEPMTHPELHRTAHIGWPRAAVLGANDGLISTSSLVVGVAAALLGALAARLGGAPMARGAARVAFWGAVAMVCTALVGRFFGTVA